MNKLLPYLPPEIKEKIIGYVDNIDIRRYFRVYNKIDKSRYRFVDYVLPIKIFNDVYYIDDNGEKNCDFTYILPNIVQRPLDNFSDQISQPILNPQFHHLHLEIPNDFVCVSEYECNNKIYYEIAIWRLKKRTGLNSKEDSQMQLELGFYG